MVNSITYKPFGNKAILIEWDAVITQEILNDILNFKYKIEHQNDVEFYDIIIGYNSLTLRLKEPFKNFAILKTYLKFCYSSTVQIPKQKKYVWEIPVCYDINFGIDLEEIASAKKMTIEEIIQIHSATLYTVFFIGFLPGFLYLGGLDKRLFINRKPNPRLRVPKGAVAIGGKQTGIYPVNSPGGWNIIGNTPISFFNVNAIKPCFARSGDCIKFTPISSDEYALLQIEVEENLYEIPKTLIV